MKYYIIKHLILKKKSKYDEYRHGIASMGHKFFG